MRKKIIAGNWKMVGTKESVTELANRVADIETHCEVVVFPAFVHIPLVQEILHNTDVKWGAQTVAAELSGAFTGEVSANMLKEYSCRYILLGHSERRNLFHETDEIITKKFALVQQLGLTPMLCVGESRAEREAGATLKIVLGQIDAIINKLGINAFAHAVIAYEPVWAIGTGLTATPEQAQEVHAQIREHFAKIDATIASSLRLLYGGSVKADNAAALFSMPDIDGGLVGGASLDAHSFKAICQAAK